MKTIQELNEKAWYRLLKVVYVLSLAIALMFPAIVPYVSMAPEYDKENSYVLCDNGRKLLYEEHKLNRDYISSLSANNFKFQCLYEDTGLNTEELAILQYGKDSGQSLDDAKVAIEEYRKEKFNNEQVVLMDDNYTFIAVYETRNWPLIIISTMGGILATLLLFELTRRIFYYVALGKFKPEKH
jgi:hypothetical protein